MTNDKKKTVNPATAIVGGILFLFGLIFFYAAKNTQDEAKKFNIGAGVACIILAIILFVAFFIDLAS